MAQKFDAAQLADLAERGLAISQQMKELGEQLDAIKSAMRESGIGADGKEFGEVKVVVRRNFRWNQEKAREMIPEVLLPLVSEMVISSAKAKENLPPAMYNQCKVETTPQVFFEAPGKHQA